MTNSLVLAMPEVSLSWHRICGVDELEPLWGEAAFVAGIQVALFRIRDDEVYAVTHRDPFTGSFVIARGIVGSRGDRLTVASPLYKQAYDLETGECFGTPSLHLRTFPVRIVDGAVEVCIGADADVADPDGAAEARRIA